MTMINVTEITKAMSIIDVNQTCIEVFIGYIIDNHSHFFQTCLLCVIASSRHQCPVQQFFVSTRQIGSLSRTKYVGVRHDKSAPGCARNSIVEHRIFRCRSSLVRRCPVVSGVLRFLRPSVMYSTVLCPQVQRTGGPRKTGRRWK